MARTFRRPRQSHPIAELNVTNLIDLGFTLLIIFMIATQLINQEQTIPVTLPAESKSAQQNPDKNTHFVAISIDAKGNTYIDTDPTPVGLAELRSRLHVYALESKPPVVRIRGDAKVPYEKIVALMDELKKANLLKFTFDTQSRLQMSATSPGAYGMSVLIHGAAVGLVLFFSYAARTIHEDSPEDPRVGRGRRRQLRGDGGAGARKSRRREARRLPRSPGQSPANPGAQASPIQSAPLQAVPAPSPRSPPSRSTWWPSLSASRRGGRSGSRTDTRRRRRLRRSGSRTRSS